MAIASPPCLYYIESISATPPTARSDNKIFIDLGINKKEIQNKIIEEENIKNKENMLLNNDNNSNLSKYFDLAFNF